VFREVARADVEPDGLVFDPKTIVSEPIREESSYPGVRIHIIAHMGKARIPLQVDIGFGDPVTPGPVNLEIPGMLDFKGPRMRAYPIERMLRDARLMMIWTGTNEIMNLVIQHEFYREFLKAGPSGRAMEADAAEADLEAEKVYD
jgi:hypothetical protein